MLTLDDAYRNITQEEREHAFVMTDATGEDNPIIFVNKAFYRLTGYRENEALGRNCRFLQGPDTNPATAGAMRAAIAHRREITVDILNYKKNGTPFWNRVRIRPGFSDDGSLQHFLALQNAIVESAVRPEPLLQFGT